MLRANLTRATTRSRRAGLGRTNHGDIVAQEELRRLHDNRESRVQRSKLGESCIGEGVHGVAIVDVHDDVEARAIGQLLPEVARVVLRLQGFGWNPERFGLKSSKIQRSPEIQNPSFKIQRSRRPWSNPKHGGGIQAHALSDPGVGMCDGFEPQITGLALNRPSDSRSLNPAGNSQLESKCSGIRKKTLDFSNYLTIQRLEIQLDRMIVHEWYI